MHAGNTRLYHIRDGKILQFTKDHTQARDLVDTGYMTVEQYYTAIERLTLKNGIGVSSNPYITTIDCQLRKNDLLVLTTDGVHYAIRSEAMRNLILSSADVEQACDAYTDANLREGPGIETRSLSELPADAQVLVWGYTENGWTKVFYKSDEDNQDREGQEKRQIVIKGYIKSGLLVKAGV